MNIKAYEKSPAWRNKSRKILDNKDIVCSVCGRTRWKWMPRKKKWKPIRFAVHHKTYENVPNEKDEDLLVMCYVCHDLCHLIFRMADSTYVTSRFFTALKSICIKFGFSYNKSEVETGEANE